MKLAALAVNCAPVLPPSKVVAMNSVETIQSPNHYEILGADPMATLDELEGLFRKLAEEAESSGDHSNVPQAIEAFTVLRDPEQRQQYDQKLNGASAGQAVDSEVPADEASTDDSSSAPVEALSFEDELNLTPDVLNEHRRELLKMFYEKKRKDLRRSGIAIGGLDTVVPYSYELLEFHLWVLAEKKWVLREESGALSISASGCEAHEQNLLDGLVKPGQ